MTNGKQLVSKTSNEGSNPSSGAKRFRSVMVAFLTVYEEVEFESHGNDDVVKQSEVQGWLMTFTLREVLFINKRVDSSDG